MEPFFILQKVSENNQVWLAMVMKFFYLLRKMVRGFGKLDI